MTLEDLYSPISADGAGDNLDLITEWISQYQSELLSMPIDEQAPSQSTQSSQQSANSSTSDPITPIQQSPSPIDMKTEALPSASTSVSTPSNSQTKKSRAPTPRKNIIPRPPNAWILYRSAKIKERCESEWREEFADIRESRLLAGVSHQAKSSSSSSNASTVQAYMSKRIADLWKSESPETKHHYFRLSQEKKLEHARLYPDYRFAPRNTLKEASESAEGSNVKVESLEKNKSTPSDTADAASTSNLDTEVKKAKRPSKSKMKTMPELCIDVQAAERTQPMTLQTLMGCPSPSLFSSSQYREAPISAMSDDLTGFNPTTDTIGATSMMDLFMNDDVLPSECASSSDLPCINGFSLWTASPLPFTPLEGSATDMSSDTCMADTHMGDILPKSEPQSPQKVGQLSEDAGIRSTIPDRARRKSTAGIMQRKQARHLFPLPPKSVSPKKKLKKAMMCRDAALIAKSRALQAQKRAQKNKERNERSPLLYTKVLSEQSGPSQEGSMMDLLVRSYDADGPSSEIEEALLCADSLIESFATMPAWSPNHTQQWFPFPTNQPVLPSPNSIESAPANMTTFNPNYWSLYSVPPLVTPSANVGNSIQFPPPIASDQVLQSQQGSMEREAPNSLFANGYDEHIQDNNQLLCDMRGPRGSFTLNDEEWDTLLQQSIYGSATPPPGDPLGLQQTPLDAVWDVAPIEKVPSTHLPSHSISDKDVPATIVPRDDSVVKIKSEHSVELNGTYTEADLLLKLQNLREVKARDQMQRETAPSLLSIGE